MTDPIRERLALVQCGGRQGSGYLLTPRLVLTAAYLVAGEGAVRITVPGRPHTVTCERAGSWYREESGLDVALVVSAQRLSSFDWAGNPWADITSTGPIPGCQAIGFCRARRGAGGKLDTEHVTGTYRPGSGTFGERHVLALDGTTPAARHQRTSPWAGMAGASVFARRVLLGVITTDPPGGQYGHLTVTPMQRLLDEPGFLAVLGILEFRLPRLTSPPGQVTNDDAGFERRYAGHLAKRHGTLRIFGIDLTARRRATWSLDTAYYTLEAASTALRDGGPSSAAGDGPPAHFRIPSAPVPAEQALARHKRVLLRGVAGSGKTTLVQWLAVTAARQELGEHLQHLRGLVPYVLPLRTIARRRRLPAPGDFLSAVDAPLTPPPGWTEKVLRDGRALVLIDGLDEIDERSRERVGVWLRGLLAAYPDNHWLLTSRPSAVADSWLADEGFAELTLAPMTRRDIGAFVDRWHNAAREAAADDPEELPLLDDYERTLLDALQTKQDLARLATNPLMCGLICALHRDRNGYLPTGRKELYDAALSMLLIRRDRERDLGPGLTEEPQIQLLQKLAYWLVKNRQSEMDRSDAVRLIDAVLPAMPSVTHALGAGGTADAEAVYTYLLARSGLLREPTHGTVDFVHRTFQDYLAARAAVEDLDFDFLTSHAHEDQWSDVIRMAVAHGRPVERARLLRSILARGDREPAHAIRLYLLATVCLEHATELDPSVRAAVEDRAGALIPPTTTREAVALSEAGPIVLELLPGPEHLEDNQVEAVALCAQYIGGDAAVPVLAGYRDRPVAWPWLTNFPLGADPQRYATEVLGHLPRADWLFSAVTEEELRALMGLADIRYLHIPWPVAPSFVRLLAAFPRLRELTIGTPDNVDQALLAGLPDSVTVTIDQNIRIRNQPSRSPARP